MASKRKKDGVCQEEAPVEKEEVREEPAQEAPGETAQPKEGEEEAPQESGEELLRQENEKLKDQLMRTLAEYDNFRKRSAKEKDALFSEGKAYAVEALLPVADNFERALQAQVGEGAQGELQKGMGMILKQLQEGFEKLGITEIDAQGEPFDPRYHNAVMHVEDESLPENTVAQVFQKGYRLGDKVIRPAMVQVAN